MLSQVHYLVRSKVDGQYLTARPRGTSASELDTPSPSYLLMFRERYDALSYLNTHGADVADRFTVESIPGTQLNQLLDRWGFSGIALVKDPLMPDVEFLNRQ